MSIQSFEPDEVENFLSFELEKEGHLSHGGVIFTTHATSAGKPTSTVNIESYLRSKDIPYNNKNYPCLLPISLLEGQLYQQFFL